MVMRLSVEARERQVLVDAFGDGFEVHARMTGLAVNKAAQMFRRAGGAVTPDAIRILLEAAKRADAGEAWSAQIGTDNRVNASSLPVHPVSAALVAPIPPAPPPPAAAAARRVPSHDLRQAAAESVELLRVPAIDAIAMTSLAFARAINAAGAASSDPRVDRAFQDVREVSAVASAIETIASFGRVRSVTPPSPAPPAPVLSPSPAPVPMGGGGGGGDGDVAAPPVAAPPREIPLVGDTDGWNHEEAEWNAAKAAERTRAAAVQPHG